MEMGPLFMTSIAQRLTPEGKAGRLECVIACFEKDFVLMTQIGNNHLAFSIDREQAFTALSEILPKIPKLSQ